jgi:hypothetical protein
MIYNQPDKEKETYQKGQRILYNGEEAIVLEVEPILTVQITGNNQIVCGNIMNEIIPHRSST